MEVYRNITQGFDCVAFVSVSQTPDINKVLRDILSQINNKLFDGQLERWETEQLIRTMSQYLSNKRYFILIDDIWTVQAWEHVRSALPRIDNGSRIITTTCSKTVAKSCCAGFDAQMYEAKPLSDNDSHRLFFKRLFSSSEDCPQDLMKVASDILKKCGGLPLAIISIAGLLANRSKTKEDWVNVLKSISAAVDKDSPIDKMKRILLLSYFDLPYHLKSCLLHLSVFPEDYLIDCKQLILLWVAEALIPGQDRESMEQLGRSYLNELINRSLVQPTKVGADGATVKVCRVHDVILEFIVSKAVDENFVTICNRNGFSGNYSSNKIRRLSIQEDISVYTEEMTKTIQNSANIRSINIFGPNSVVVKHASEFFCSQVLRVLNLQVKECYFGRVKSFGQLKYLRIENDSSGCTPPEDIDKLQHLETLDVFHMYRKKLPASIIQLRRLVRLRVYHTVKLPDGIGNLKALEELSLIGLGLQNIKFIHELGDLSNLKVLRIWWQDSTEVPEVHRKACIASLSKLVTTLWKLDVWGSSIPDSQLSFMFSCASNPPPLRSLALFGNIGPSVVPYQIISSLVNITRLDISSCRELIQARISILASLPMLLSLTVRDEVPEEYGILYPRYTINSQGFQVLVKFNFKCLLEAALEFEPGAKPKLQRLNPVLAARSQFKYGQGGLVLGLQNLACLKHVVLTINCDDATRDEVQALEDDIRGAVGAHSNRPMLQVQRYAENCMAQGCSRRPPDHPMLEVQ